MKRDHSIGMLGPNKNNFDIRLKRNVVEFNARYRFMLCGKQQISLNFIPSTKHSYYGQYFNE
jgi:hypothetical protein